MDPRLEAVDKLLANTEVTGPIFADSARELAFAIQAHDPNDPATLNWLATCAVMRADELEGS